MVSFQCQACSDVVKKPKLDNHYHSKCHAGFDCIDCSKSFANPNQWKSHTQCISEAEKYQKSLYKGPKERAHKPPYAIKKGAKSATGPNSIPVNAPPQPEQTQSAENMAQDNAPEAGNGVKAGEKKSKKDKKRKADEMLKDSQEAAPVTAVESQSGHPPEKKPKKEKKKANEVQMDSNEHAPEGATATVMETVPGGDAEGDKSREQPTEKKQKKEKKRKADQMLQDSTEAPKGDDELLNAQDELKAAKRARQAVKRAEKLAKRAQIRLENQKKKQERMMHNAEVNKSPNAEAKAEQKRLHKQRKLEEKEAKRAAREAKLNAEKGGELEVVDESGPIEEGNGLAIGLKDKDGEVPGDESNNVESNLKAKKSGKDKKKKQRSDLEEPVTTATA